MSRKRLSLGIGVFALDKVVVSVVQILMVPVLANMWGLTLYGIWTMIMTIPSFLVLGDFGIVNSAGARMIQLVAQDDTNGAQTTLNTAWTATLSIIAVLMGAIAFALWKLPDGVVPTTTGFGEADSRLTILLLLAYGLLTIIYRLNATAYRAVMLYTPSLLCQTVTYLVENIAVVVLAASGYGPVVAASGLLATRIAATFGTYLLGLRLVPSLKPGFARASWKEWQQLWGPALAASAFGFGLAGYLQGSVMILGAVAGAAAIPAFTAVRTLSRLGVQIATLVSLPVAQEFASAMGKSQVYRAGRFFGVVLVPATLLSTAGALGLVVLGVPFVRLWTHGAIVADQDLIVFMAISSFASMFWNPLANLIMVINRQRAFSYANLAISAVGLLQIYLMAGSQGATAAGISFALVDSVTLMVVVLFIWQHWLVLPEFRSGIASSIAEIRRPMAMLRSLRKGS